MPRDTLASARQNDRELVESLLSRLNGSLRAGTFLGEMQFNGWRAMLSIKIEPTLAAPEIDVHRAAALHELAGYAERGYRGRFNCGSTKSRPGPRFSFSGHSDCRKRTTHVVVSRAYRSKPGDAEFSYHFACAIHADRLAAGTGTVAVIVLPKKETERLARRASVVSDAQYAASNALRSHEALTCQEKFCIAPTTTAYLMGSARDPKSFLFRCDRHRVDGASLEVAISSWQLDDIRRDIAREAERKAREPMR
jgi:hypothetical protein